MFSYGSLSAVPEEGCLYLRDNVGDRALLETLADNLSHEGIPGVLELYAQPRTVWEDPSQAQQPGEFQCGEEEIEGAAAVVTYVAMWPEEMEDEIGLDSAVIDLKRRLDSLQIPYAFGMESRSPATCRQDRPGGYEPVLGLRPAGRQQLFRRGKPVGEKMGAE